MKKYMILLSIVCSAICVTSCNDMLELQNDGRITMEQVFKTRNGVRGYLNACYNYRPVAYYQWASHTDDAQDADGIFGNSLYSYLYANAFSASFFYGVDGSSSEVWASYYAGIRKCNVFLANMEHVTTSTIVATEAEITSWKAQAYTLRAFYYLQLIKRYGAVPLLTEAYGTTHDYSGDRRAPVSDVVRQILEDCDAALAAPAISGGFSWTVTAGQRGIMNRAVVQAIRSQAITFAVSPLFTDGTYSWADATRINGEALSSCLANGYELFNDTPAADIAQNAYALYFITRSDEQRAYDKETIYGGQNLSVWQTAGMPSTPGQVTAGSCPTQELVDCYEMQATGEPPVTGYADDRHLQPLINTASGYDPNNPYEGRDPRFYASIYYNGAARQLGEATLGRDDHYPLTLETSGNNTTVTPADPMVLPAITSSANGLWLFSDADNFGKAEKGRDLVPQGDGIAPANGYAGVGKGSYFLCNHGFAPNGGGRKVNEYTLMIDFMIDRTGQYYSFLQTTLANDDDGELFIRPAGECGIGGYYAGAVEPGKWQRYFVTVKCGQGTDGVFSQYLNGEWINTVSEGHNANLDLDGRFALDPDGCLLFADEDGEDNEITVRSVAIWNRALSSEEILGDVIPTNSYHIETTGSDPYVMTSAIGADLNVPPGSIFIRMEYKAPQTIANAQFFFAKPNAAGGVSTAENIVFEKADDWTEWELDITAWAGQFEWGESGHRLRFDVGSDGGFSIDIRNLEIAVQTFLAPSAPVDTYVGATDGITTADRRTTRTGYYLRKYNNWKSGRDNSADGEVRTFRLAELYLNFAESACQSDGPDAVISLGNGISMSARDAVNAIRARALMPPFPAGMSREAFEKKYRNERRVEMAFEEHRYFDVRRWKILEQSERYVTGMRITQTEGGGFNYERIGFERASGIEKYYLYPIDVSEANKMRDHTGVDWQNPGWN